MAICWGLCSPSKLLECRSLGNPNRVRNFFFFMEASTGRPGCSRCSAETLCTRANMALRAVRSLRAAIGSLRAISAPSAPCSLRPWGLRAGAVRALRTGPALLSGKCWRARGPSRAASGERGLASILTSGPRPWAARVQRGDLCAFFVAETPCCGAVATSLSCLDGPAAFVLRAGSRGEGAGRLKTGAAAVSRVVLAGS